MTPPYLRHVAGLTPVYYDLGWDTMHSNMLEQELKFGKIVSTLVYHVQRCANYGDSYDRTIRTVATILQIVHGVSHDMAVSALSSYINKGEWPDAYKSGYERPHTGNVTRHVTRKGA